MKKSLQLIPVVLGIFMLNAFSTSAQTQKFGHINSAEIIALMPDTKKADEQLQSFGKSLEEQLRTMGAEYQTKLQDYQSKSAMMADPVKQAKEKEIVDLQTRIQEFQQTAQESIQRKKEELYSPILKRADEAIKEVAKENNYTYILDSSIGAILFAVDANDIDQLARKKLGIAADAKVQTAAQQAAGAAPLKK
jgi:outer membrane protein